MDFSSSHWSLLKNKTLTNAETTDRRAARGRVRMRYEDMAAPAKCTLLVVGGGGGIVAEFSLEEQQNNK